MSFNLFGPATKNDIRLGYIHPTNGYVDGINICDANKYAKLNPGTTFVLKNREKIRFLNINEVNKLTADDLEPGKDVRCEGVTGLDIYNEDGTIKEDLLKPDDPKVYFYGGGGIGAQANPIFGNDGSLLAVDLIYGGWGYQYAPVTEVIDPYGIGAGAVTRSILVGDPNYPGCRYVKTVEVFDQEDDFEEYDLSSCSDGTLEYGRKYDFDGKDVGKWDPTVYANLDEDPIRIEIQRYQDFLQSLMGGARVNAGSNTITEWWSTRKFVPLRITSSTKTTRNKHDVSFPAWSDFMNEYAISPVPPSNVPGSDYAGVPYTFEWEEDFPYSGEYTFRGACDNKGEFYFDNIKVADLSGFKGSPVKIKRTVEAGVHRIRLDLLNIPIKEKVESPEDGDFIDVNFTVFGQGSEKYRQIKFIFTATDGSHSFVFENVQKNATRETRKVRVKRNTDYDVVAVVDDAPSGDANDTQKIKISYDGLNVTNNPINVASSKKQIKLKDGGGADTNATFSIKSTSPGVDAKFSDDGTKLVVTGQKTGDVTLKLTWDDNPGTAGVAVKSITIGDTTWNQIGTSGEVIKTVSLKKLGNTKSTLGKIEQGTVKNNTKNKEGGNLPSGHIFADFVKSRNDNDDMQVIADFGIFTPSNKRKIQSGDNQRNTWDLTYNVGSPATSKKAGTSSSQNNEIKTKQVFNTVDYINRADRRLWRINPGAGRDAGFLNQYGVLPFDPASDQAQRESFAGVHVIRWEEVNFPVDGNYNIEIMVDDEVDLYIGNRDGGGKKSIGNGLIDISRGGDEVIIRKRGFSAPGTSTGKSFETRFFKAGKYRIRAELKQINVGPLAKGNPMALAINIETSFVSQEIVSAKSWNENPMGIAFTIDAPMPPVPQEPKPEGEGRCPNNPLWTTRFPGSQQKWWPVTLDERWSRFMNRYALSPIPPLSLKGSDGGGSVFRNSWVIEAPYDGFYGFKSTVDNGGRILVDGNVIVSGGLNQQNKGIFGFRTENPKTTKFFMSEGRHTISVEVENQQTNTYNLIDKKIFSTRDWQTPAPPSNLVDIVFDVYGQGSERNRQIKFIFTSEDNEDSFTINNVNKNNATKQVKRKVRPNVNYAVVAVADNAAEGLDEMQIKYEGLNSSNNPIEVVQRGSKLNFKDGRGDDINATFIINSSSPGFNARFSADGKKLLAPAQQEGDITLTLEWDDDPSSYGKALDSITIGGKTWRQSGQKGKVTKTIQIRGDISGTLEQGTIKNGKKESGAPSTTVFADYIKSRNDNDDMQITSSGGIFTPTNKRGVKGRNKGRSTYDLTFRVDGPAATKVNQSPSKDGVTYVGPTPITSYRQNYISPVFENTVSPTEEIQGKTWLMRWEGVDFPEDGTYTLEVEADDRAVVKVDGQKIGEATLREGLTGQLESRQFIEFRSTKGRKSVEIELTNVRIPNTGFQENPTVVSAIITTKVSVATGVSQPWTTNPIGISAVLIPPPCPKEIEGKGVICRIVVDDPGNGFPRPTLPPDPAQSSTYPISLALDSVEVEDTGINYSCGSDQIQITPNNGAVLDYECDTFGRITRVNVIEPGLGFTTYPNITMISDTGVNATFRPQFRVIRDPIVEDQAKLIQVTDLVGLKQTGYVDGRPYYGAVFYKNNIRYAGFYETPGRLVQVYDTLQESITAQVVTPPSAIQRQGTDIRSNNPRLNIPGTPENLI